jgi:hypothetical protein
VYGNSDVWFSLRDSPSKAEVKSLKCVQFPAIEARQMFVPRLGWPARRRGFCM